MYVVLTWMQTKPYRGIYACTNGESRGHSSRALRLPPAHLLVGAGCAERLGRAEGQ